VTETAATRLEGDFDYILVGAGSAGCVLANRLSADPGKRVLLLEAGGRDNWIWFHIPVGYLFAMGNPRADMVYARGLAADYDDWRAAGNPGWGWSDVEPVFRAFERRVYGEGRVEGDGPLTVSYREREYHPVKRYFLDAAREIGLPATADINAMASIDCVASITTQRSGSRAAISRKPARTCSWKARGRLS